MQHSLHKLWSMANENMFLNNMFTMWYSAMHGVPNSWGIQTMNTLVCIHLLNFSSENWNGMHAVVIMCACSGCYWFSAIPTSYSKNKPDYPLALSGWELFYGAPSELYSQNAARKNNSEPNAYHPATYTIQITSYYWAILTLLQKGCYCDTQRGVISVV